VNDNDNERVQSVEFIAVPSYVSAHFLVNEARFKWRTINTYMYVCAREIIVVIT